MNIGKVDRESIIRDLAVYFYKRVLSTSGIDLYCTLDSSLKPVALCMWKYPKYMANQLDNSLNRYSYLNQCKSFLLDEVRTQNHPFYNSAMYQYAYHHGQAHQKNDVDINDLLTMGADNLFTAQYPQDYMPHCMFLLTEPHYQGQGIGRSLLNYSLSQIPPGPYSTLKYQKLNLWATSIHAEKFYRSLGFQPYSEITTESVKSVAMCLTR